MFSRFDTVPACDRRTDRQTDVQPISITCFSIADARKNQMQAVLRLSGLLVDILYWYYYIIFIIIIIITFLVLMIIIVIKIVALSSKAISKWAQISEGNKVNHWDIVQMTVTSSTVWQSTVQLLIGQRQHQWTLSEQIRQLHWNY